MTTLADLVFSDLCIDTTISNSWLKVTPDSLNAEPLPPECHEEVGQLLRALDVHFNQASKPNFRYVWQGNPMRVQRMQLNDGRGVYVCRQFKQLAGGLAGLGMPKPIISQLLASNLREGLVVFMGKAGAGKTTAAGTLCVERLETLGGVCWTIENPIEMALEGRHGNGICYQTEADSDEHMAALIAEVYRATPNMIFVGEARDGKTVREAVVAGLSGHLVFLTLHAGGIITGISRMSSLHGGVNSFRLLADALRVLIHVNLHHQPAIPPQAKARRILSVEPLVVTGNESIQATIREGALHLLGSEIDRQRRIFMSGQELR